MRKKILILVANIGVGGQQRMALLLADGLKSEYDVSLLIFSDKDKYGAYSLPEGIQLINIDSDPALGKFKKICNILKRAICVKRIKQKNNIDISISFGESANIVNAFSNAIGKTITSIRNSSATYRGVSLIDKFTISRSDMTIFISKGQRDFYRSLFPNDKYDLRVIYNACDKDRILKQANNNIPLEFDKLSFVTVSRLSRVKCLFNLINAFAIFCTKYPNAKLYILGDGELKTELSKYIEEHSLCNNIHMLGNIDNPFAYVSKSRALLNSSGSESFSNVVLEGLACGVPVISGDCMFGPREILSNDVEYGLTDRFKLCDYGILTPAFELDVLHQEEKEQIFAEAIEYLISNQAIENHYRDVSVKRSNYFSSKTYLSNWNDVLSE